ncbi:MULTISPECIES: hypothetical protein [Mycobacteriaceae]|uniref:Uncharacterized protein n=1 Tax=Mycolicibacterium neoaurum VKM Ac-1815D TaxID=700508 RepID=V5XH89_MYCNE|nr:MULTISPECIES: hypothetical protein [Mycobacteriaceae]AHC27810.1 hypothetical protein D174_04145 [Mycolicibacterium neoaurum VKM Ac-1815D]AMO04498.1 hypothetical protein MyAD_04060 [Mycolicibacterium neoaurum]AXK77214.1 hypothetical protein DXK33_21065 [Mycolicibacterium neoaurum]KJQ48521.1 hypothetical protein TS71_20640 [Mycolicibacterium neoaurum]KUM06907.1 hypothetical protein AVZ31_18810 [Mycolicibacterium neoaurum]
MADTDPERADNLVTVSQTALYAMRGLSESDKSAVDTALAEMRSSIRTGSDPTISGQSVKMVRRVHDHLRLVYRDVGVLPRDGRRWFSIDAVVTPYPGQMWRLTEDAGRRS